jgi:hypothetical protein
VQTFLLIRWFIQRNLGSIAKAFLAHIVVDVDVDVDVDTGGNGANSRLWTRYHTIKAIQSLGQQ